MAEARLVTTRIGSQPAPRVEFDVEIKSSTESGKRPQVGIYVDGVRVCGISVTVETEKGVDGVSVALSKVK